ncbi:MAG: NifB/NifX family molybdenum-iron cluster-binding protein [Chloroflexales bacterium]
MKIAFVSDDGTTIHRHFGRARQYVVVTIEDGQETNRELRAKSACHGHDHTASVQDHHDDGHHDALLAVIADCQFVVAGGMGAGMDERLRGGGITPIRTRIPAVDTAVERYLSGRLTDTLELVH